MHAALLPDRGVVKVAGDDARRWLGNLVTIDMGRVAPGAPRFGALLTPQGKIIADFIVVEARAGRGRRVLPRLPAGAGTRTDAMAQPLQAARQGDRRGHFRRARRHGDLGRHAGGRASASAIPTRGCRRSACAACSRRIVLPRPPRRSALTLTDAETYEAHRIALGVPRGGLDFSYGDAFPHETDMDQFGGVDFDKGCYIGQEVVSRVEHRATARNRIVPIAYDGFRARGRHADHGRRQAVGTLGSTRQGRGLALMRLDRVADALAQDVTLEAGNTPIRLVKPDWAQFAWPGEPAGV